MSDDKANRSGSMFGQIAKSNGSQVTLSGLNLGALGLLFWQASAWANDTSGSIDDLQREVRELREATRTATSAFTTLAGEVSSKSERAEREHDDFRRRLQVLEACFRAPKQCPLRG